MKFGILVNEGPYQHQAADTAFNFAKAALDNGHEVERVFFYHDGVNNGTRLTTPPQDDRNIVNRWSAVETRTSRPSRPTGAACIGSPGRIFIASTRDGPPGTGRSTPTVSASRAKWSELAKQHDLDLVVCVAAAQRRGIVDPDEAKRHGKNADNIADGFRISGLGQLIEMGIKSDRLVTFGD